MFSCVWSSAGYEQWKAVLISIEGLLEDKQGLSMGEMLTVNFRHPNHEFTFNVGIDLISKLTILTLMICQVCTRMWYLEFIVYAGIKHLNEDFRVFIKHFARRSWSLVQVKTRGEHDSKRPKDQSVNAENYEDLDERCWSLHDKESYPNCREHDVKDPHAVGRKF
jgi:hypothetical protein